MNDHDALTQKGNLKSSAGVKTIYDDEKVARIQAIIEPHTRSSEKLIKVIVVDENGNQLYETSKPVLNNYKERITKTKASANYSLNDLALVRRIDYLAETFQGLSEEFEDEGYDFSGCVNTLANTGEIISQTSKGFKGWAGELIHTQTLNEKISHDSTQNVINQTKEEPKKKRLFGLL